MNNFGSRKSSIFMVLSWAVTILILFLVFKALTGLLGVGDPASSNGTGIFSSVVPGSSESKGTYETDGKPSIVLLDVKGVIGSGLAERISDAYDELADDDNVLGVILNVNSPGGGVTSSERVRIAGLRFAEKKPLYAAIYEVGASGAYMSSLPASKIYAYSTSIVGSIGVIEEFSEYVGLMKKIGVNNTIIKSGKYKATGYSSHELTQEEIDNEMVLIDALFTEFVNDVVEGRNMTEAEVRNLAEGQVFTGVQSLDNGLIDELGDYNDAFEDMKAMLSATSNDSDDSGDSDADMADEIQLVKYDYNESKSLPSIFGTAKAVGIAAEALTEVLQPSSSRSKVEYRMP